MSEQTEQPKKEFNPTLAMLYNMKNGSWSLPITSKEYDAIMKHVELGGRLVIKPNNYKRNDKSPDHYLEFIPKAKLQEREAFRNNNTKATTSDEI